MTAAIVALAVLAALGFGLRLWLNRPAEDRLRPGERVASIAALHGPLPGNSYLVCPPGYCPAAPAATGPVFAMPWQRLREYWFETIADNPRITEIDSDAARRHLVYIERTAMLRFPDIVTVEFAELGPERSGIAIYSRSRYGRADFGTNRRRVRRWIGMLERAAGPAATRP